MMPVRPRPLVDPFGVEALGAENMGLLGPPAPVYPPEPPADVMTGQSVAPSPAAASVPVRALQAATARHALQAPALPAELGASSGYGSAYDAAVASGRFTPQQLQAAEASRARHAGTPLGLQGEALRIGSKGTLADLTANIAEQRALATAQERADAASANAAVVDEDQAKRFEAMRAEFDESQNKRLADMDELRADIAKTKIDPSQYWSKGSGFGQALSLLSVAIGGFAKGYSGGRLENTGLKMLDQAIDRDIAAQRDNLSTKRGLLAESQSVFSMARQRFGDDQAAAEFTKARQNEMLKNAAARYQGEARTKVLSANAAKLVQHFGLEERRADNNVQQLNAQYEAARLRAAAGAAAGAASAEEREFNKELALRSKIAGVRKAEAEATESETKARGDGEGRKGEEIVNYKGETYSVDKSAALALRAAAAAAEASKEQADSLIKKSAGDYYTLLPGMSKKQSEAQPLLGSLQASMATILASGGMPSDKAEANARKVVSEVPQFQSEENWAAGIKEVPGMLDSKVRSMLRTSNARLISDEPNSDYKTYKSSK